jgi:hypothetical protein
MYQHTNENTLKNCVRPRDDRDVREKAHQQPPDNKMHKHYQREHEINNALNNFPNDSFVAQGQASRSFRIGVHLSRMGANDA